MARFAPSERHRVVVSLELFAIGVAVMACLLVGVDEIFAHQTIDDRILLAVAPLRGAWLDHVAVDVTALGSNTLIFLVVVIGAAILWLSRERLDAIQLLVAGVGAGAAVTIAKLGFGRPRPTVIPHLVDVSGFSFPSGHALVTTAVYATLAILARRRAPTPGARRLITGAAAIVIAAVSLSRVYLGVHDPSDVLAGLAAGLVWATAVSAVQRNVRPARVLASAHATSV